MSDHYNQPELADLYDDENVWDASADFYLDLGRRLGIRTLLDLGCGTGTVTRGIAAALGCRAVGVDPAAPMLAVARRKTTAEAVEWIEADARTVRLGRAFDLIIMTGHAFQAFVTEEDQAALLATMAAHLDSEGRFAFDTRNPAAREWLEWTPDLSRRVVDTEAYGGVEIWNEQKMDEAAGILDVVEHYRILATGKRLRSDFRLRFSPQAELGRAIAAAGLAVESWFGDWDRTPFAGAMREIIAVGRLAR
ncbi:MAG TPA: class I SAM-dependent methyltransferase [Dongiaceae bacterium]|jgi:SAM-dependent methyltransferase|nr:class I SAM-dependent methyltransferase [Dongiaceae bacterium]